MSGSLAILIPVHFPSQVSGDVIRSTLEATLRGQDAFCPPGRVAMIVDRDSQAHRTLRDAGSDSPLHGPRLIELESNRGKTGAVRRGLEALLESNPPDWILTRDCDTDHDVADIPRFLRMASDLETTIEADRPWAVFGARSSWEKPMGWLRQEWERMTNGVVVDCAEFLVAREGTLLDRRFWSGFPLDLQSGYRLYNKTGAETALMALSGLPERPEVYTFACEILPFVDIALAGGMAAQVQTLTRVGQPFSSYADVSLARCYGELLRFMAERYGLPTEVLLRAYDNGLAAGSLYFSEHRDEALRGRSRIAPHASPPELPRFV